MCSALTGTSCRELYNTPLAFFTVSSTTSILEVALSRNHGKFVSSATRADALRGKQDARYRRCLGSWSSSGIRHYRLLLHPHHPGNQRMGGTALTYVCSTAHTHLSLSPSFTAFMGDFASVCGVICRMRHTCLQLWV